MSTMKRLRSKLYQSVGVLLLGGLTLSYSSNAEAPLDVRVALVIGNSAYQNFPTLANPSNDAQSMAVVLRKLGFNVVEMRDGNKAEMARAIEQMQSLLQGKNAVGMLYYAGHGLQLDWHNYMVPVDAQLSQASDVPQHTIDIENVINTFKKSATRMNIIVLDACRDNPFSGKTSSKGLAQLDAPPGTYLAFATSPGNVAEDGDESTGNGLFTQYLLKELQRPARIEEVFKRVRFQVRQKSQGRQIPWDSSSLEDDFSFNDGLKYTFKPEDLIKEVQQAKARETQLKQEAEAAREREQRIAEQRLQEQQKLAEAQKIRETEARQKAEADAKDKERQLALAAALERQKAQAAAQALVQAQAVQAQLLKDIEQVKLQASNEAKLGKLSPEQMREQQFALEKAQWDKIKDSPNKADFYEFLNKYPSGLISELASAKIEILDRAKIKPQADKQGLVQDYGPRRYAQGDAFEFVGKDGYTGIVRWNQTFTVLKVDEEGAEFEGVRTNAPNWKFRVSHAGPQYSDNRGSYDPPVTLMPAGLLQVGYKWTARTNFTNTRTNRQEWLEVSGKVVGREAIQIPAGKFDSFKLEVNLQYQYGDRIKLTAWADPSVGTYLKSISEFRTPGPRGGGDITVRELVAVRRGG